MREESPRQRGGWRWIVYRIVTGPRFPLVRLTVWTLLIPLVVWKPALAQAVMFVTILSIAAGIESALTDVVEAWKWVEEEV